MGEIMKRLLWLSVMLCAVIAVAWFGWRNYEMRKGYSISSTGGRSMAILLPELGRTYLQGDPLWRHEKLGSTSKELGSIGCTVCSVAMAATSLGFSVTPSELNRKLTEGQGFTREGWFIWGALAKATDQKVQAVLPNRLSHEEIDDALSRNEFPVIKFVLNGVTHWVVIVGKDGLDYLVRDPLVQSESPVKLSSRTTSIYSVRFVRRKAA
jgi:hypothetical protein